MRSIFRDFSSDFFPILTYPREKWCEFWREYRKKHRILLEDYSRCNCLSEERERELLLSFSRKCIDMLYLSWTKEIREVKAFTLERIGSIRKQLEIEREDFTIHLVCALGITEKLFVRTLKTYVIMIDPVYIWTHSSLDEIPEIVVKAAQDYRRFSDMVVTTRLSQNEKQKRLNRLLEIISDDISNQNMKKRLQTVAKLLDHYVEYYDWTGFYLAGEDNTLFLDTYVGEPTEHTTIPFGSGICGQAASSKKTFLVPDVSLEKNYLSCSPKTKSEIVVPILHQGRILGELDIDSHRLNTFDELDNEFLGRICDLVAPALASKGESEDC